MARKTAKENPSIGNPTRESVPPVTGPTPGIVENRSGLPAAEGAVEVQAAELSGTTLPTADLIAAKDALKQAMGGFGAVVAAMAAPGVRSMGKGNIIGWAIGEKLTGNAFTGEMAVKVYVSKKHPRTKVAPDAMVPASIHGIATDVHEVGEIVAQGFMERYRPAPGGSSIGQINITAGTHGGMVVMNNGHLCILSNNHVLADVNQGKVGDNILQPGRADGGIDPQDRIATLENFVPIDFVNDNTVDCAVAWTTFELASPRFHCFEINPTPLAPSLQLSVRKCGRTTGHTLGDIIGLNADVRVRYDFQTAVFQNQIQIRGRNGTVFSQGGDSGSLIVSAGTLQPVALLFSGGGLDTFANPIAAVMSALGIQRFLAKPE